MIRFEYNKIKFFNIKRYFVYHKPVADSNVAWSILCQIVYICHEKILMVPRDQSLRGGYSYAKEFLLSFFFFVLYCTFCIDIKGAVVTHAVGECAAFGARGLLFDPQ